MYVSRTDAQHQFSEIPSAEIPRSIHDRSHGHKTTFDAGYLVPIYIDEALPGDTFSLRMTSLVRMATPIFPVMDNLRLDTFFFAVPYRLVWDNWQKFCGEQKNPGDSTDFLVPEMTAPVGGYAIGSLEDHMGLPVLVPGFKHSALYHRAVNLIWNEWFRDQNLQDSLPVPTDDGPDNPSLYTMQRRGKRKDYFSSSLPWPQKGPAVEIPLGTTAPVITTNAPPIFNNGAGNYGLATLNGDANAKLSVTPTGSAPLAFGYQSGLVADLSSATASTVNQLRQSFAVQRLYERDARGGTRYVEQLKSHFGVTSPDFRLQRPEILGTGTQPITFTSVPQTSGTGAYTPTPQGNLSAYSVSSGQGHGFSKSFVEHCLIIGFACVRADLNYQQGLDRLWSRRTRWDFYWPALSHIGEQAVLRKEIMCVGTNGNTDEEVWGYQERWAEYRYKPSVITGLFRSIAPQSLDSWHLAQEFSTPPTLSAGFIEENPPVDRVVATPLEPQFLADLFFQYKCARPMPTYSVPGLIDHF